MNVRTVRGKMDLIIDMMNNHEVDVMAILETRLRQELEPAAKSWAKRRGCSMVAQQCYISKQELTKAVSASSAGSQCSRSR